MKAGYTALNFTWIKEKGVIILATVAIYVCFESAENIPNMNIKLWHIKKFSTVFLEAYHCRMGRYLNMNQSSRSATENFVFLKVANNGSLKTNCCFEWSARWNALAKKLACLKLGNRLLWSLGCWINFFHFHQWGLHLFLRRKNKSFSTRNGCQS